MRAINSDLSFIIYQCDALAKLAEEIIHYHGGLNGDFCSSEINHLHLVKGIEGSLRLWVKQSKRHIEEDEIDESKG